MITTFLYHPSGAISRTAPADADRLNLARRQSYPITYAYDGGGALARKGSDKAGWLWQAPESEFGWELPHGTYVGGVGRPGDLVAIAIFLAIYDGTIDHVANDISFDPGAFHALDVSAIYRALGALCARILGRRLSDIAGTLDPLPSAPVDPRLTSARDLARTALAAALSHQRLEGTRAA